MLLRYLKEVVFDKKGEGVTPTSGQPQIGDEVGSVSTDRRNELLNFVHDEIEKKEKNK